MNDTFEITCFATHKGESGKSDSWSDWQNVSDEGIITTVRFHYPSSGLGDRIGDKLEITLHLDSRP